MATFLATFLIFGLVVLSMAVGVLLQGRRLRGSCGGTSQNCECSPLAARHCRLREAREAQRAGHATGPGQGRGG
ncbi:MAG: (Na+)-NQR maturation NqrM [Planctomycetota bacterium]